MSTFPGTAGNDSIGGTAADDLFLASAGSDSFDGGPGFDTLSYAAYRTAIRIALAADGSGGTVDKPGMSAQQDQFVSIEHVIGTAFGDVLLGSTGGTTPHLLTGGGGPDTINGYGSLLNIADFSDLDGVSVFLSAQSGTANAHTNSPLVTNSILNGIVAVHGSPGDDALFGSFRNSEVFHGGAGNDTFQGGSDYSGAAPNEFHGGPGTDIAQFVAALSSLTFTIRPSTSGGEDFFVGSAVDGTNLLDSIETLRAGNKDYGHGVGATGVGSIFYFAHNPDVGLAGVDAEAHYAATGWREGRDPNPFFSGSAYLGVNPDVRAAGINPLQHYLSSGAGEGRDPNIGFDSETYLARNPDVRAAGVNPFLHYLGSGRDERRAAFPAIGPDAGRDGFDAEFYLFGSPDVRAAGVDAEAHFRSSGFREGRDPNAYFDTAGYLAAYKDVAAAGVDPLLHYINSGWKEGRDPSEQFDTNAYLDANPDVAAAGVNPLLHFLGLGHIEGRVAIGDHAFH